ncbi:D-2-hydroxyacid dehydrogenase [Virgibacillus oceani]
MILFSARISQKHKNALQEKYPDKQFVFCNNMDAAKAYIHQTEVLVTYGEDLHAELITNAAKLKWIMVLSAGMETMPFKEIAERGIYVTNARGIHKTPMAEYAISMLLQVLRETKTLLNNQQEQIWDRSIRMQELKGKTMLVLGTGAIGQETARLAQAFGVTTVGVSKSGKPVTHFDENHQTKDLESLVPHADLVVSVLPSTKETEGLFKYGYFEQMPNHAIFLNMGRGDLVKSGDLLKAIQEGEIAHAILDVFEEEPLSEDHPFWKEVNITITPHLSGMSKHYVRRALAIFEKNLQVYHSGKDDFINKINTSRGY